MNFMNYMMGSLPPINPLNFQSMMFDPMHYYGGYPMMFMMPQPILENQVRDVETDEDSRKGKVSDSSGPTNAEDIKTTSEGSGNSESVPQKVQRIKYAKRKQVGKKRTRKASASREESEWAQGSDDSGSSAADCPKKYRNVSQLENFFIFVRKKKYKQNACRNILTNIGNQIITFLCSPKKSGKVLLKASPELTDQEFKDFYSYTTNLRRETDYYLNIAKLKKFWLGNDQQFGRLVRILSAHYLRWVVPLSILTSKKMSTTSRLFHSRTRKFLLSEIKTPN